MYSLPSSSSYLPFVSACAFPYIGGFLGGYITRKELQNWYKTLKKPSWTPPGSVIGPVWTTLYGGMGAASYLVWRDGGGFNGPAKLPLALYAANIALNWTWPPLFFRFHKIGTAFGQIIILWGTVAGCVFTFYSINKTASFLMIPYLGWLSLATCLNYCIWRDNKGEKE